MSDEKRQTPRIAPFVAPCRIRLDERQLAGFITDLSARGARVTCEDECPPVGKDVTLEVKLGRKVLHAYRLPGRVAWSAPAEKGGHSFGLTFAGLAQDEQRAVESVVDEFHRLVSQLS
jgi:hypothetical protein